MMRKYLIGWMCSIVSIVAFADSGELAQAKNVIDTILHDNQEFAKQHHHDYFERFAKSQHPRATVVTCADSRVHDHALEHDPDNDLFIVRNIGNQLTTAEGSVEYGVHHLHTPLLLIVGHSACGAIKAASSDFSKESDAIKRELSTIKLSHTILPEDEKQVLQGVIENVNHQVSLAQKKFNHELKQGQLVIVGAVYDFTDVLHHGEGKLTVTNVNGDTNQAHIKKFITSTAHHKPLLKHRKS
jgi:carbonic anhydrase